MSMWYKVTKWLAWMIGVVSMLYLGTAVFMFVHVATTSVYETPWGKVDTDTAKIGFMEYWSHSPCYEVHREMADSDTVRFYFFKSRAIYYKACHDSTGQLVIRLYYPQGKVKDGEVCTDYFRSEDIFIR